MRGRVNLLAMAVCSVLLASATGFSEAAIFQGLGDLPGGTFESAARGISDNGLVVVGNSRSGSGYEAFRWEAGAMTGLGDLAGGPFYSFATGVSADGAIIVGTSRGSDDDNNHNSAFIWSGGVMTRLPFLPGTTSAVYDDWGNVISTGDAETSAAAISADGTIIVGQNISDQNATEPVVWDGGVIAALNVPTKVGSAGGVGTGVIVGQTQVAGVSQAVIWSGGSPVGLGVLPGGTSSTANAVTPDGSVVVGSSRNGNPDVSWEAFRWEGGVMTPLGIFAGGTEGYSKANDVSADGSIIVGYGRIDYGPDMAFIWDAANGLRVLQDVLADMGADLDGWHLGNAQAITPDGTTIVGWGTNPSGNTEGWIATIPEPSAVLVLVLGAVGAAVRRR